MKIGIVGATGLVGRTMIQLLQEHPIGVSQLDLFASERSLGRSIPFHGKEIPIQRLSPEALSHTYDFLFFSAGSDIARKYAPIGAAHTPIVIDNSSAFRKDPHIPLIVPEVNGSLLNAYQGIVANPNCSTIQMVLGLYGIHMEWGIEEIVVVTFQSVSGAGNTGILEFRSQQEGSLEHGHFPNVIHENVIPIIGDSQEDGFTTEERKMIDETRKILNDPNIRIFPTCVRVPVVYGHSEAVFVRTSEPIPSKHEIARIVDRTLHIQRSDGYHTPQEFAGSDHTGISRLRFVGPRELMMWIVADNVRVGAATNALRIMERALRNNNGT